MSAVVMAEAAQEEPVMSKRMEEAASLVAGALGRRAPEDRGVFLREILAHAAAGLVVIEGDAAAGEAVYRLADAVVGRGNPDAWKAKNSH